MGYEALRIMKIWLVTNMYPSKSNSNYGIFVKKMSDGLSEIKDISIKKTLVYYQRGLLYKEYNNFEQAIKDIKQATELEPDNAIVLNELGLIYQFLGDLENALYYYKKACSIDFYNIEYRHNLGLTLFEKKKYQEAIVELKRIIRFTPDNADIHFNLAQIFELTKNYREAIESFENFLRIKGAEYENKDQITARIKYLEDCFYINKAKITGKSSEKLKHNHKIIGNIKKLFKS